MKNQILNLSLIDGRRRMFTFRLKLVDVIYGETFHPKYEKTVHDIVYKGTSARVTSGILIESDIHLRVLNLLKYEQN